SRNNEVFFDDVRIPAGNMLGEKNRGWYHMATSLDFEQSGLGAAGGQRRALEELVQYCADTTVEGQRIIDQPRVQNLLAEMSIRLEVLRMLSYRVVWMQSQRLVPNAEASVQTLFSKEYGPWFARQAQNILEQYGQLTGSKWAPIGGS